MAFNYEDWAATMERMHGPDWKAVMRERAAKGGSAKTSKGTAKMSPEKRAEVSRLGVEGRRRKYAAKSN